MKKLTHGEISENRITLETLHEVNKVPVHIVLDNIRSSYNVGSIFRTSDGAMIEKLYLCGYTPAPPKKDVLKTALGSTESVEWVHEDDPVKVVKELKAKGIKICALEQTSKTIPHYEINFDEHFPVCMIVGNEITGVSQELIDLCDFSVELPQYGIKQSLNVAVAYGIAVFKLREVFDLKSNGEK